MATPFIGGREVTRGPAPGVGGQQRAAGAGRSEAGTAVHRGDDAESISGVNSGSGSRDAAAVLGWTSKRYKRVREYVLSEKSSIICIRYLFLSASAWAGHPGAGSGAVPAASAAAAAAASAAAAAAAAILSGTSVGFEFELCVSP